jgi:hypothetical protein
LIAGSKVRCRWTFRIVHEKEKLERILRDKQKNKQNVTEADMQLLVQLVNEKQSIVRRQEQLNIAQKVED